MPPDQTSPTLAARGERTRARAGARTRLRRADRTVSPGATTRPNAAGSADTAVAGGAGFAETPPPPAAAWAPARDVEREEHLQYLVRLRRMYALGCFVWPAFGALDLLMIRYVTPAPVGLFLTYRAVGLAALGAVAWRLGRRPEPSPALLRVFDAAGFVVTAALVSLMCLHLGGIASPYWAGVAVILAARGGLTFDHWRRNLWQYGLVAAPYPLVCVGAAALSFPVRRQFGDPVALALFAQNLCFLGGVTLLMVYGGHSVWTLRRHLFESRNVGRYQLGRRLGAGGMGEVWAARDRHLKRDVALKILHPDLRDEVSLRRFRREIDAASRLVHPNTVRVFDYGVSADGLWHYSMELVPGETLKELVARDGPLAGGRAVRLFRQLARALAEAHAAGIVHRDLKPANVMVYRVADEEVPKLLDFGIARLLGPGQGGLTQTGWIGGTPAYISPEAALGEEADARSDLYSLGATLYFALTGRPPFDAGNAGALLHAHIHDDPPPPSAVLGAVLAPGLEELLLRCLRKDPAERFPTALALAAALGGLSPP